MKKKVVVGIVLLTMVTASLVYAQSPTMDKLKFSNLSGGVSSVSPINNWITGAVVIPSSNDGRPVTTINSFRDATSITSVVIPDSVTSLSSTQGVFRGITGLTSVTIGSGLATIGSNHFRETGLTSVTIPPNVTRISNSAFADCVNLTSVTFLGPTTADNGSFPGNLPATYRAASGGPGTYTRSRGSDTWTKGGTAPAVVTQQPAQPTQPEQPAPSSDPTLSKMSYTQINGQWRISAANKSISGDVVIPSTWDGRTVQYIATAGFEDCRSITSVTFPSTIVGGGVAASAFVGCTNLTMVIFRGNRNDILNAQAFEGDLSTKLRAGGPGTYTRDRGGRVWTKID